MREVFWLILSVIVFTVHLVSCEREEAADPAPEYDCSMPRLEFEDFGRSDRWLPPDKVQLVNEARGNIFFDGDVNIIRSMEDPSDLDVDRIEHPNYFERGVIYSTSQLVLHGKAGFEVNDRSRLIVADHSYEASSNGVSADSFSISLADYDSNAYVYQLPRFLVGHRYTFYIAYSVLGAGANIYNRLAVLRVPPESPSLSPIAFRPYGVDIIDDYIGSNNSAHPINDITRLFIANGTCYVQTTDGLLRVDNDDQLVYASDVTLRALAGQGNYLCAINSDGQVLTSRNRASSWSVVATLPSKGEDYRAFVMGDDAYVAYQEILPYRERIFKVRAKDAGGELVESYSVASAPYQMMLYGDYVLWTTDPVKFVKLYAEPKQCFDERFGE